MYDPGMRIIALRGVPGSGKSTWAAGQVAPNGTVRVNKDDIRRMLCPADNPKGYEWSVALEELVCAIQDGVITSALQRERDVIVDNTNINPGHIERLREIEQWASSELEGDTTLEIEDFDVDLEVAIDRDHHREHEVGADLIKDMYRQLEEARANEL